MVDSDQVTDSSGVVSMVVGEDGDLPGAIVEARQARRVLEQWSCSRLACCHRGSQKDYFSWRVW